MSMKFKNKIHPTTLKHLQSALNLGKIQMEQAGFQDQSRNVQDFGSNYERIKSVSEFEEAHDKNLDNYVSNGVLDLRPRKGKKFSEWLETNHPEIFESSKIVVGNKTTRFVLDGHDSREESS